MTDFADRLALSRVVIFGSVVIGLAAAMFAIVVAMSGAASAADGHAGAASASAGEGVAALILFCLGGLGVFGPGPFATFWLVLGLLCVGLSLILGGLNCMCGLIADCIRFRRGLR